VRGNEDHRRHPIRRDRIDERETSHLPHLDIEQDDVGREVADRLHRFGAVSTFADDLRSRDFGEETQQPLSREGLVVNDQNTQSCHVPAEICVRSEEKTR